MTIKIFNYLFYNFMWFYQYPENYVPPTELDNAKSDLPGSNKKRTLQDIDNNELNENLPQKKDEKKAKMHYKLETVADALINADTGNKKYWDDCKTVLKEGKKVCNY